MTRQPFSREFGETILVAFVGASDRECEPYVRNKVIEFRGQPHTDAEVYDFIVKLSDVQCDRLSQNSKTVMAVGYIVPFLQTLTDLKRFRYERPAEGITTPVDVSAIEKKLRLNERVAQMERDGHLGKGHQSDPTGIL
jgi:hypothetical protein